MRFIPLPFRRWTFTAVLVFLNLNDFVGEGVSSQAQGLPGEGVSLVVKVSHRETKSLVSEVIVSVRLGAATNAVATAATDGNGRCTVAWPIDWDGEIRVRAEQSGFAPIQKEWFGTAEEDSPPEEFSFVLTPSQRIGGRVLDQNDQPVGSARIIINFPQRLTAPRVPLNEFRVYTDATGHWTTDIVPAGVSTLSVTATHPNCVSPDDPKQAPPTLESLIDRTAVIRLERTLTLLGRVLNPDGQPVKDATVVRGREWGIMGVEQNQTALTDEDGRFEFERVTEGRYMIAAQAKGFGPAIATAEVNEQGARVELKLTAPQVLEGKVIDLDGNPIEGVGVRADDWERYRYPGWETQTDSEGRFRLRDMPLGIVAFDFTKGGYMGRIMHRVSTGEGEQIVKLGPVLRLHGRVLDAETKAPIDEFSITPGWPRQVFRQGKLENAGGEWATYDKKSMRNGAFDLTFDRPIVAGAAELYDFLLRVDAGGYDPAVSRAFKPDERDAEFDFLLHKGTGLNGTVKMPDGSPARNAKIYAYTGFNGPYMRNGKVLNASRSTEYSTGRDGSFTMSKPLEEMNLLVMNDDGYAESNTSQLNDNERIVLNRWARIRGVLRVGRKLGVNEKVAVRVPSRYAEEGGGMRHIPPVFRDFETTTDDQGRFEFDRVPSGDLCLVRVIDLPRPQGMGITVGDVWGGCPLRTVRVKAGEMVNVEIGGDGRVVTGRLIAPPEISHPVDWSNGRFMISHGAPRIEIPENLPFEKIEAWLDRTVWSDSGKQRRRWLGGTPQVLETGGIVAQMTSWYVAVEKEGFFRIQDFPPGNYRMTGWLNGPPVSRGRYQQPGSPVARVQHAFRVPDLVRESDEASVDLGEIQMQLAPKRPPAAPPFVPNPERDVGAGAIEVKAPHVNDRLTAGMIATPAEARPGDTVTVRVKVRILPGYSIGGLAENAPSQSVTSLDLELPDPMSAMGPWEIQQPAGFGLEAPSLYRDVVFGRSIKVSPEAQPGPLRVGCQLKAQVGNLIVSWPTVTIPMDTSVEVVRRE